MIDRYSKLTDEIYEFIKGEVVHLLQKYKLSHLPISGFEIATRMGVSLIPYSAFSKEKLSVLLRMSKDGFFLECNGKEYIYYNNIDHCYERQNWTILHLIF